MTDLLSTAAPTPAPAPAEGHAHLQYAALRDLLQLSHRSVQEQQALESAWRQSRAAAEERFAVADRKLQQRSSRVLEEHRRTSAQALKDLDQRYAQKSNRLKQEGTVRTHNATRTAEEAVASVKQRYEQKRWLAESVCEAAINSATSEYRAFRDALDVRLKLLEEMIEQTQVRLRRLLHRPLAESHAVDDQHPALGGDPAAALDRLVQAAQQQFAAIEDLGLPRWLRGVWPWVTLVLVPAVCVVAVYLIAGTQAGITRSALYTVCGLAGGAGLLVVLLILGVLWMLAGNQLRGLGGPLRVQLALARLAVAKQLAVADQKRERHCEDAKQKRQREMEETHQRFRPMLVETAERGAAETHDAKARAERDVAEAQHVYEETRRTTQEQARTREERLTQRGQRWLALNAQRRDEALRQAQARHDQAQATLRDTWTSGQTHVRQMVDATARLTAPWFRDWTDPAWQDWQPARAFPEVVRFGRLDIDIKQLTAGLPRQGPYSLALPPGFAVPALLGFPAHGTLLVESGLEGRDAAIAALQATMTRLLTSLPPGRVRFTLIDPVGLGQSFAAFMHLTDHDEQLVGPRIWTESEQISQRLVDLTNHMENVIQKYLRNEYETIDQYNIQAGELAEPYRYVVIADFPVNFTEDSARRVASIVSTGARCGVYCLIAMDQRQNLPTGVSVEDLRAHALDVTHASQHFTWRDEVYQHFPLALDVPPAEEFLTRTLHVVGEAARESNRVEVPFTVITPGAEEQWSASCDQELRVPIGRTGATRQQYFRLGRGVAQHALIAGKTGSGKSTLLHVLITNLSLWYRPEEVEFYLIDFKKGVEFKTYASHRVPHARAVAIESDREFGLSVLRRLDEELRRRGALYRQHGVQELAAYRTLVGAGSMPRVLLIVDEFQEFFSEDDKIAQDAALLLDRMVRQGRAFGMHVILGSQTLSGTSGLGRSTVGQMSVRLALQCSEADSQLILSDNNSAARLLSRPGEAIYNDAGGIVEGNSPFQVAWLADETRDEYLKKVEALAAPGDDQREATIVFEGNADGDLTRNPRLAALLDAPAWPTGRVQPRAWLGEAVAIKDPTAVPMPRQSGANLLIVGQRDESAAALLAGAAFSLAAQHRPGTAEFVLLDGTPADSPLAGVLPRLLTGLPHPVRPIAWRDVAEGLTALSDELTRRREAEQEHSASSAIYVFIYGLQRYRILRKQEESFGFSLDGDQDKTPQPDKQFAELLREGPAVGIHVLLWIDTPASLDRALERQSMREFDHRVLFQMSATDSSNLIDSPIANQLGFHRALYFSEELGVLEKFRPYALPPAEWVEEIKARLSRRGA